MTFPQPIAGHIHGSLFVHSILKSVEIMDSMKSECPILGERDELDYHG